MEDLVSDNSDIMNQAAGTQIGPASNGNFRSDFFINRDLPSELAALGPISAARRRRAFS
jgi:hypothetical protein